jgi:hypothetical protein
LEKVEKASVEDAMQPNQTEKETKRIITTDVWIEPTEKKSSTRVVKSQVRCQIFSLYEITRFDRLNSPATILEKEFNKPKDLRPAAKRNPFGSRTAGGEKFSWCSDLSDERTTNVTPVTLSMQDSSVENVLGNSRRS